MNAPRVSRRITAAVMVQALLFLWLLGLSVAIVLGYHTVNQLAEQVHIRVESQQVLALEARVAELANNLQTLENKPESARAADSQDVRQALHARIAQIEQAWVTFALADDVQALRGEMEQIKARQAAAVRTTPPPVPRRVPSKLATVAPQPEPFPYRVLSIERRAGLRSVSVAPLSGQFSAEQIQVLLSGEVIGVWRLQGIDGDTAIFQSGEQIRRIPIPNGSES